MPDVAQTHQHIRYRSFFASGRPGALPTSLALAPMHKYILAVTGEENDGLVAKDSAKYGEFQQPFWPCDHLDMSATISISRIWASSNSTTLPPSTPSSASCRGQDPIRLRWRCTQTTAPNLLANDVGLGQQAS